MLRPLWVILGVALVLSGCQTVVDGGAAGPIETAALASNELNRLGRDELQAGNFGLAERHFRGAVEANDGDVASWIGLAAAYDNLRRFDLADRAYAEAARLDGQSFTILNNLGYSYFLRGDRARALAQFRKAELLAPGSAVVRNNMQMVRSGERPNRRVPP